MRELVGGLKVDGWMEGRFRCLMLMVKVPEEWGTWVARQEVEMNLAIEEILVREVDYVFEETLKAVS